MRKPLYPHVPKRKEPLYPHQREVPPRLRHVVLESGKTLSWDAWLRDLQGYQKRGETLPKVEYPRLKCKYCGTPVPEYVLKGRSVNVEIWAGYHVKGHREAVRELAEKKLPWSAGLIPIEGSNPGKEPFIKVGERVRFIDPRRKSRYESWPKDKWLEYGVTGKVTEYHPESPEVRIKGEIFEALPPYAVVRWDLGGAADTAIDPEDEGKRWERI